MKPSIRTLASSPERLESRIAPAVLLTPRKVSFTDSDGDNVIVTISKGDLTGRLTFDTAFNSTGPQELQSINLADVQFKNAVLTVKVVKSSPGDALVNVGYIDATGIDLASVSVAGDLGQITVGDGVLRNGSLKTFTVNSLGAFGTTTGASSLLNEFYGSVGAITVLKDVNGARINIDGEEFGNLGVLSVGGSLIGADTSRSGNVNVTGKIGPVRIGVGADGGGISGGVGPKSGQITSGGSIGRVTIHGDLTGGDGELSGSIKSGGRLGFVTIFGSIVGGDVDANAGTLIATGDLSGLRVSGSVLGGEGDSGAGIISGGGMGPIEIAGDLRGGGGVSAGEIRCSSGILESIFLGGSLIGGAGDDSGEIAAFGTKMGPVTIMKDIVSELRMTTAGVFDTAEIEAIGDAGSRLTRVTVHGSLLGGNIIATGNIGNVKIFGSVEGGKADRSGFIGAEPNSNGDLATRIGTVTILQDLHGGDGAESGTIAGINVGKVTIGRDLISGNGSQSGSIRAEKILGSVTVKGGVIGTAGHEVIISGGGLPLPLGTADVAVQEVLLVNDTSYLNVLAGYDLTGAPINGHAQIGRVKVGGDWTASNVAAGATAGTGGFFGSATDAAVASSSSILSKIASINIAGSVIPTANVSDSFGFVAEQVSRVRIGGVPMVLQPGAHNDVLVPVAPGGDLFVNEV